MRCVNWRGFAIAACAVATVAGCRPVPPITPANATLYPTFADNPKPTIEPYVLQVGDQLGIKFYTNPELNEDVEIRPDGMISLQLVDDVRAAGLTPKELDDDLSHRYAHELADPQVSVIVRKTGGQRVFVAGEVTKGGTIDLVGGLTLYQAVQTAGGFTVTAHRKQVILIRKGPDGTPVGRAIDVRPIEDGTNPSLDIPLRPLDVVFVPRSKIADVDLFVQQYIRDVLPVQAFPIPAL